MSEERKTYYSQHPVPQHVLGVEFKLVGGLTIRQFAYVGGSLIIAYLVYASILPVIFRIPLAFSVAILGISLSFIPVNDRPMDQYLKNFLIALTSPTERVWIKESASLDIFYESYAPATEPVLATTLAPKRKDLREYLGQMKIGGGRSPLDIKEEEYLKTLSSEFSSVGTAAVVPSEEEPTAPPSFQAYHPERIEVKPAQTLASEVNLTNQKIITLPAGKNKKFVTSIKNVKAGRKLHTLPTVEGEIVMPVAGEIIIKAQSDDETAEQLLSKAAGAVVTLEKKMAEIREPSIANKPTFTAPIAEKEEPTALSLSATETPKPKNPPYFPDEEKAKLAGQIAVFNEELDRLKKQNEELLLELNREKKQKEEAERIAEESRRYQERIRYLQEQNEKLNSEMRKIEEDYKKVQNEASTSKTEKENSLRLIREQQRRLEALAKEKTDSIDEMVRLQKELQILRGRGQKIAQEEAKAAVVKNENTLSSGPTGAAKTKIKPAPFVKDIPNVINGYVKDKNGALVKNAVIIVKDQNDDVVRALKTNDLGQFAITTPLPNGLYHVEASVSGSAFDIITVDLIGTVLEPIEFDGR